MSHCPWPIHICHLPGFGPLAVQGLNLFVHTALRTTVCKHERMTPAVKAGYMAPYDSWAHRVAVLGFVLDIPLSPQHPSYEALKGIEEGLAQLRQRPMCFIWGMAIGVLHPNSWTVFSISSPRPRYTAWPTQAITSSRARHGADRARYRGISCGNTPLVAINLR